MNKKAIMTEAVVRLTIAVIALVTIIVIGGKIWSTVGHSDSLERFNNLADNIEKLQDGDYTTVTMTLDKTGTLIGFTNGSENIEFIQDFAPDATFSRPASCNAQRACLCYCQGLTSGLQFTDQALECDGTLHCRSLDKLDFPSTTDQDTFYPRFKDYTFNNGFILQRDANINVPRTDTRLFTLQLERENNIVKVCEPSLC